MSNRRRPRRGFTLIEAAVALAIVSAAAVAALATASTELRTTVRERRALEAAALADDRLAALTLLGPPGLLPEPDSLAHGRFGGAFADYSWEASVESVLGAAGLSDVRVAIHWDDGVYELRTRLYQRPRTP